MFINKTSKHSLQEESVENWSIIRTIDGKERDPYVLDVKTIKPGIKITVNAAGLN